ncbi:LysE family translocator [Nesterenkonia xinjiangensis]|uniref:Threonine/homoserine/homoserine lactone efflux protein n=1 Tax=Nesterenkonia xinjiangensis TaxID=225327 RepID=A0A7Z0KCJ5_9MICC|nr:LysE family transporter [Nesterenkonia xinjiangensis]NYJ78682.1 threonine/homoserine/homoserine lactone efflux protein [Nesterenkonia xinjiangensis]
MEWSAYVSFLLIAALVIITPGSDTAVVLKNALMSGRRGGVATALGVTTAVAIQGVLTAAGLGVLISQSQPVLQTVRWIGVAYLAWLALQALRSAWQGQYTATLAESGVSARGYRQGFLTNITNPAVLMFYLALFPQFMTPEMPLWALGLMAGTMPVLGLIQLVVLTLLIDSASRWLQRRRVRRVLDSVTGLALGGLSLRVALQ